ncbi:MAG: pre-peptidase C-terminal domain-containing protein, partial [Planctomycetota bacterium]
DLFESGSTIDVPEFYQLVATSESATTEDDLSFVPTSVNVDADAKKVTIDFGTNLNDLVTAEDSTAFRLRVGDASDFEDLRITPIELTSNALDPGQSIATATDLTTEANAAGAAAGGAWTLLIDSEIDNVDVTPLADNAGGRHEPGHRDHELDSDMHVSSIDGDNGITVTEYTFFRNQSYGVDASGAPVFTQINDAQEQRFRETLEIYSALTGVEFVETESSGLRLIVGDLFAADPDSTSGPGGVAGLGGPGQVTMDFADFATPESNAPGLSFFQTALHEVGHALGLRHAYDIEGALMGDGNASDWVFPGLDDIVHLRHLHQREALDVDLYRVELTSDGNLSVQTNAERLADSSLLDSRLVLYREEPDGSVQQIAANDDYFGSDALIDIDLPSGTYFVAVAADGNVDFDIDTGVPAEGGVSEGAYQLRMEFSPQDVSATMTDADGSGLDGDRDGLAGGNYDFWFRTTTEDQTLYVQKPSGAAEVGGDGSLTAPLDNIDDALAIAAATTGAIVRILPSGGSDDDLSTPSDATAYEIGRISSLNRTLEDGRNLVVPNDTTVMIDAGAILKFQDARIGVGSDADGVNRSGSAIQVLGTPDLPVWMTSYSDTTLGANSNPIDTVPGSGDWGGLEIRNDVDRDQGRYDAESQGLFLNHVNHASIRYGGGVVSTLGRVIDPIHLSEARAEVSYNTIRDSSNAAISADPNTFEVTTFTEPRFQSRSISGDGFVPDVERNGPVVHGNQLLGNSTNGLFVRIDTEAGSQLESLQVAARFDDTDVVHVLGENLLLDGKPGGPIEESRRASEVLGLQAVTGGDLAAGEYRYSYTFVDGNGFESRPSTPQSVTVGPGENGVQLLGIPLATGDFVGRIVYRSDNNGPFREVAQLDRSASIYQDNLAQASDSAATIDPTDGAKRRARPNAALVIDPGTIIKSQGARIELDYGTTLIAEGVEGQEIIFTSRQDDTYGASGTFDTNDDGGSTGSAGDWAGIYAGRTARLSVDRALIKNAGGVTGVEGTTAGFSPIEIHQAEARIANSVFTENANGTGGQAGNDREGRGPNSASTIHVTGAQPTIVGNIIDDNAGAAIGIDVNSLSQSYHDDLGRQTGLSDLYDTPPANQGPVVRGNQIGGSDFNGMLVRGGNVDIGTVWDDTDIVHILQSTITDDNFHTYGGIRFESAPDESLVVKVSGASTEIIASGEYYDITDRVGGRVQVLGTPGFPVVITSISDDTVGAGFAPDGTPQTQTQRSPGTPMIGDWRAITLTPFSHDRNVDTLTELEGALSGFGDQNSEIGSHQDLGQLAPDEFNGDENLRLGFTVLASIAAESDEDVYSFRGTAGTSVWIDVDRTDAGLDTVLELVNGDGEVLALSDSSRQESDSGALTYVNPIDQVTGDFVGFAEGHATPMQKDFEARSNAQGGGRSDLYSLNDGDSAMRVVLPGSEGTVGTYYVRVRSNNASDLSNPAEIESSRGTGQSLGGYQLQIRLQENDEIGGSIIRYADIRYASTGVDIVGLPAHSPLTSTVAASGSGVNLGSLGYTDQGAISVARDASNPASIDSYTFDVFRPGLQVIPGVTDVNEDNKVSAVIDVDYSDGLNRQDTTAYLYHDGVLVAIGTDSNITDDRLVPSVGGLTTDESVLTSASYGASDPFIGPLELSEDGTYTVRVVGPDQMAEEMTQFTDAASNRPLTRLEPLDSTIRISDQRFQLPGERDIDAEQAPQTTQVAFDGDTSNVVPWHLGDVSLVARTTFEGDSVTGIFNPFTGRHEAIVLEDNEVIPTDDEFEVVTIRPDGSSIAIGEDDGFYVDDGTGFTRVGDLGINLFEHDSVDATTGVSTIQPANDRITFSSLVFASHPTLQEDYLYAIGTRGTFVGNQLENPDFDGTWDLTAPVPVSPGYVIYRLDPATGAVISRNNVDMPAGFETADPVEVFNRNEALQDDDNNAATPNVTLPIQPSDGLEDLPTHVPHAGSNAVPQTGFANNGSIVRTEFFVRGGAPIVTVELDNGNLIEMNISTNGAGDGTARGDLLQPSIGQIPPYTGTDGNPITPIAVNRAGLNHVGPDGFDYSQLTFVVDDNNDLYAFDQFGNRQSIFAFGADHVGLDSIGPITQIDFPEVANNLWHLSETEANTAGHGFTQLDNDARPSRPGGGVLRFGLDDLSQDFNHESTSAITSEAARIGLADAGDVVIGGMHGAIQSNALDLSDVQAEDLPTLYFTYKLNTQNSDAEINDADDPARDTLRVYVAGEDGVWALVATNNFGSSAGSVPGDFAD